MIVFLNGNKEKVSGGRQNVIDLQNGAHKQADQLPAPAVIGKKSFPTCMVLGSESLADGKRIVAAEPHG